MWERYRPGSVFRDQLNIAVDHHFDEPFEGNFWMPAYCPARLGAVAAQMLHICGPQQLRVYFDMVSIVQSSMGKCDFQQTPYAMRLAGGDYIIVGLFLLQHEPHRTNIISGETPVPFGIKVSHLELVLKSQLDPGHIVCHAATHELNTAARGFVIEQNA